MALKSDDLGFLVGDRIDTGGVSPVDILKEIKSDTASIRRSLNESVHEMAMIGRARVRSESRASTPNDREIKKIVASVVKHTAPPPNEKRQVAVVDRRRDDRGRFLPNEKPVDREASATDGAQKKTDKPKDENSISADKKRSAVEIGKAAAKERERDANGRFKSKNGSGDDETQSKEKNREGLLKKLFGKNEDDDSESKFKKLKDALKEGAENAAGDVDKIDPVIEAGNEIKEMSANAYNAISFMLKPLEFLSRPFRAIFGAGRDKINKQSVKIQQKMLKKLTQIEQQRSGAKGLTAGKLIASSVLFRILSALFTPVTTVLKAAFMGGGKLLFSAFKAVFMGAGRVLITALSGAGKLVMGALRFAFSPVGLALGALFGGFKFGEWLYKNYGEQILDAIESIHLGAKGAWQWIQDSWDKAVSAITSTWENVVEKITGTFEDAAHKLSNLPAMVMDAIKSKLGIAGSSGENRDQLSAFADKQGMSAKEKQAFMQVASEQTGGFMNLGGEVNMTPQMLLDKYKGRNGLETIAQAREIVAGGAGSINEAIYGGEFGRKNLGNIYAGDAEKFKGRGFSGLAGRANYASVGNELGIDLLNNPELASDPKIAAQIAMVQWRQSGAQYAAKRGNIDAAIATGFTKPITQGSTPASPEISRMTSSFVGGDVTDILSSSIAQGGNIMPVMAGGEIINGNGMVISANLKATKIPKPTPVTIPLASGSKSKDEKTRTIIQLPQVGQNMSDRSIAQVVTGGMGNNN